MKAICNFRDLEDYGIECLTGEACAYGYRLLCDLTPQGKEIIEAVMDCKLTLNPAWNTRGEFSIMLPPSMFECIAVFALFRSNCSKVFIMYTGEVYGVEADDSPEQVADWVKWNQGHYCEACHRYGAGGGVHLQYSNPGYDRNRHQMSGRTR